MYLPSREGRDEDGAARCRAHPLVGVHGVDAAQGRTHDVLLAILCVRQVHLVATVG